jgi:hypothetical protein
MELLWRWDELGRDWINWIAAIYGFCYYRGDRDGIAACDFCHV